MKNPYERMRKRLAAAERAKAGGKPGDRMRRYVPRTPEATHANESTALRDDSPPTVAAYFATVLGRPLADPQRRDPPHVSNPSHPSFHIETGCGEECKAAIDACAAFVAHVRDALGEDSDEESEAISICAGTVLVYVYG